MIGGVGTRGEKRRACSDGIGVCASLQQALGILVIAELDLCDERSLAREDVPALESRGVHTRNQPALLAVFEREHRRLRTARAGLQ